MNERTTWVVVTAALGLGWAVVVALAVIAFTDWSGDMQALVGGAVSGSGGAVILGLRLKQLPASRAR